MIDLLTAFALVFVIEGLILALIPHRIGQILAVVERTPPEVLRGGGLAAITLGVIAVWLLRG